MKYIGMPGVKSEYRPKFTQPKAPGVIIKALCTYFNEDLEELKKKSRVSRKVYCRYVIFYFLRKYGNMSLSQIGYLFEQHHATVMHGLQTLQDRYDTEQTIRDEIEYLIELVVDAAPTGVTISRLTA